MKLWYVPARRLQALLVNASGFKIELVFYSDFGFSRKLNDFDDDLVIFFAMFVLAAYLYWSNRVTGVRFLLYSTTAMFVLGTIQMTLKLVIAVVVLRIVRLAVEGNSLARCTFIHDRLVFVRYILLTTNKSVKGPDLRSLELNLTSLL